MNIEAPQFKTFYVRFNVFFVLQYMEKYGKLKSHKGGQFIMSQKMRPDVYKTTSSYQKIILYT